MPPPTRQHTRRRNAKPKHAPKRPPKRYRNAGPPAPRPVPRKDKEPSSTLKDKLVHLAETLGGAGLTSLVGAYAVKWGLAPELVSTGLGVAGGLVAVSSNKDYQRLLGAGAASAAGSQLLLLKLNPAAPKVPAPAPAPASAPPQVAQLPRPKNADLGALPPGMLDAAFERARAELAVAGDGYPPGYDHAHHVHHG